MNRTTTTATTSPHWQRLAWLPLPCLLAAMAGLWVADPRTSYESRALLVLTNTVFTWAVSLCIGVVAGRSFLGSGQPGLLLFGCGALLWGFATLVAGALANHGGNVTITIHNLGVFGAAFCYLGGLTRSGRVRCRSSLLATGYAGSVLVVALLGWAAATGITPVFFIQGQGGTLLRQLVLGSAIGMLAMTAWLMLSTHRRQPSGFLYYYGLGLALLAAGLCGVWLQTVHGSALGWAGRITQCIGGVYLFIAAMAGARETGGWKISLAAVEKMWRRGELLSTIRRKEPMLWLALCYGLAVVAVAAAFAFRAAVTAWVGPGLPTFITFYPAIMLVAVMGGFGPGALATVLTVVLVDYWVLPPVGQSGMTSPVDRIGSVIFSCMGVFMSAIAELYRRNKDKAAAYDREVALRETEARLRRFYDSPLLGVISWNMDGKITDANDKFLEMVRYTREDLTAGEIDWARMTPPEHRHLDEVSGRELRSTGVNKEPVEKEYIRKDGSRVPILVAGAMVDEARFNGMAFVLDITPRKRAEEALQASLREKEVMLKEIHHRVKNNLQVIASLVDLQAEGVKEPDLLEMFGDIRDRVRSMALVHEKLYQSERLARVDFNDYMESLLGHLSHSHRKPGIAIEIKSALQPVALSVEKAVPCGLMVNELVSNAYKYAFRGRAEGEIRAGLGVDREGRVWLRVGDNGVGLPPGLDWRNSSSLGLRLIQLLAGQLHASVEVRTSTGHGTEFEIVFELVNPEKTPD